MNETALEALSRLEERAAWLSAKANWIRLSAMTMTNHANLGHTGGDLSSSDILATLYLGQVLQLDPANPLWPQRDRFVMSKGHCSGAFYSALALCGFFPVSQLKTFMDLECPANSEPVGVRQTGMEGAWNGQGREAHA